VKHEHLLEGSVLASSVRFLMIMLVSGLEFGGKATVFNYLDQGNIAKAHYSSQDFLFQFVAPAGLYQPELKRRLKTSLHP
jgi:hypothetical protein